MDEEQALKAIRGEIDELTDDLVRVLNARAQCAIEVGKIKRATGATAMLYRADREADVLRRVRDFNPGPLSAETVVRIVREVMSACLALEQPLAVAYFGPAGTYTHAAAQKHFGSAAQFRPLPEIDDVIREVETDCAAFGVVPIENSLEGPINVSHDLLHASTLIVCGEVSLPIHHQLLSVAPKIADIRQVYAHSQALAQCRHWLDSHCSQANRIAASSNAEAARLVADKPDAAALAGTIAAELYHLPILASNIEDRADNTTRFLVLGKVPVPPTGDDLTTLVFSTHNRAGALSHALQALASAEISMSRLQSRPMRQGNWDYLFFVDLLGHQQDPHVAAALQELRNRTATFRILGSYPRAVF